MIVENKTFIISGGISGAGKGAARALCYSGAHVALYVVDEDQETIQDLPFGKVTFHYVNSKNVTTILAAIDATLEWTKETGKLLAGVICCPDAEIPEQVLSPFLDTFSIPCFQESINMNLVGTLSLIRLLIPTFAWELPSTDATDSGDSHVVIIISPTYSGGYHGQIVHEVINGAISSMSRPLARDLGQYDIRVVSITSNEQMGPWRGVKEADSDRKRVQSEELGYIVLDICQNPLLNGCCIRVDSGTRLGHSGFFKHKSIDLL